MKHTQTLALLKNRVDLFERAIFFIRSKGPKGKEPEKLEEAAKILQSECWDLQSAIHVLEEDAATNAAITVNQTLEEQAFQRWLKNPAAWLELDDALARQGYMTAMCNKSNNDAGKYEYTLICGFYGPEGCEDISALGDTRLEAVRLVYEQVMQQKDQAT